MVAVACLFFSPLPPFFLRNPGAVDKLSAGDLLQRNKMEPVGTLDLRFPVASVFPSSLFNSFFGFF